jgi:hypothetical protein
MPQGTRAALFSLLPQALDGSGRVPLLLVFEFC